MYASTEKQSEWTKLKYNFIGFAHLKFSIKFNNKTIRPFSHTTKKKKKLRDCINDYNPSFL